MFDIYLEKSSFGLWAISCYNGEKRIGDNEEEKGISNVQYLQSK
jgi:hypothetical protein